jgi:FlaA1/EpsC-like NDP-sugar epimerase
MFDNAKILITGGTGSWGQELTKQLLSKYDPKEIVIFSRNENNQFLMQKKFNNKKLKFIIGDIRDVEAIDLASRDVDYIFHLAAMKHVPVCEFQPYEAIKTNINGSENIIKTSIKNKVKKVINISTDKSVEPINLYGMTKAVGEKLFIHANLLSESTRFICIRAGNVIGSNGSAIPLFIKQIKENNVIEITNNNMTRYFLTLEEAIGLIFKASIVGFGGETFVMHMPSCKIIDLANVLGKIYGDEKTSTIEIGIRPGEKIDECLISENESYCSYYFDENYYVIFPQVKIDGFDTYYNKKNLSSVKFKKFTSNTFSMSKDEIRIMLNNSGF